MTDTACASHVGKRDDRRAMWVIFIEMGVVLALIALILWWTWPRKQPKAGKGGDPEDPS